MKDEMVWMYETFDSKGNVTKREVKEMKDSELDSPGAKRLTAEEVAKQTVQDFRDGEGYRYNDEFLAGLITTALTAYADERVKEALDDMRSFYVAEQENAVDIARAEALEKAEQAINDSEGDLDLALFKIRALKDKK